jgi:hypothetical protein
MTRIGIPNSWAILLAWCLQPALFGVQLQNGLVKLKAVISTPSSNNNLTASELSNPPDKRAIPFLFMIFRHLEHTIFITGGEYHYMGFTVKAGF